MTINIFTLISHFYCIQLELKTSYLWLKSYNWIDFASHFIVAFLDEKHFPQDVIHGFNFNLSRSHSSQHPWHYCPIIRSLWPNMSFLSLEIWIVTSIVDKSLEWRMGEDWVSGYITNFTVDLGFRCYWNCIRKFQHPIKFSLLPRSVSTASCLSVYNSYYVAALLL